MTKPDWKNAKDYAYIDRKKIKRAGVAWEFLRRNPEYQKDYRHFCSGKYNVFSYEPHKFPGESDQKWMARCVKEDVEPVIYPPEETLARKWGLRKFLFDPDKTVRELKPKPQFLSAFVPKIIRRREQIENLKYRHVVDDHGNEGPTLFSGENIIVVFNLNKAVKPQWERIKGDLSKLQQQFKTKYKVSSGGSPKSSVDIPSLRAWDAVKQNPQMPKTKIATIIYGGKSPENAKTLNSHHKVAKSRIYGGYLDIADGI